MCLATQGMAGFSFRPSLVSHRRPSPAALPSQGGCIAFDERVEDAAVDSDLRSDLPMGYAPIADPVVHGAARHLQILADSMGLNHISSPPMSGTASRHIKESSLVFSSLGITLSPVGALFYIVAYHLFVQPL